MDVMVVREMGKLLRIRCVSKKRILLYLVNVSRSTMLVSRREQICVSNLAWGNL